MPPVMLVAQNRGFQALLQPSPQGTLPGVLILIVRSHQYLNWNSSFPLTSHATPLSSRNAAGRRIQHLRSHHTTSQSHGHRTVYLANNQLTREAVDILRSALERSDGGRDSTIRPSDSAYASETRKNESLGCPSSLDNISQAHAEFDRPPLVDTFRAALSAVRKGDTRRLIALLRTLGRLHQDEFTDTVAAVPRTTITEFFRALDPLEVAKTCDHAGTANVTVGMFKMLYLESKVDDWGIQKLYSQLFESLLTLMKALKSLGHPLHTEEYIVLLRCAGATADIPAVKTIWDDLNASTTSAWRDSEVFTEFIKARFSTEPLYTGYQKTHRMVTPRNMHRARIMLGMKNVLRLDLLRYKYRSARLFFGANRDTTRVDELQRWFRHVASALRLYKRYVSSGHDIDENFVCAIMIAFGRAGELELVGTEILWKYFGITTPRVTWLKDIRPAVPFRAHYITGRKSLPPGPESRLRPTVRLMRAIVETYGSNGEIRLASQLVWELSRKHNIQIPQDVWQDLLEWTYIMSAPPASTAWKKAGLYDKIPEPGSVESIWQIMTTAFQNEPTFDQYSILIRTLLAHRLSNPSEAVSYMRTAVGLYHQQCQKYETAVFECTQLRRAGARLHQALHQLYRARFEKERMWYEISTWCRKLFFETQAPRTTVIPNPLIPSLVEEFRPFVKNPIEYRTPTGSVSLTDPALEPMMSIPTGSVRQVSLLRRKRAQWGVQDHMALKTAVMSVHALADFKLPVMSDPLKLLVPRPSSFEYGHSGGSFRYTGAQ
ncbi:mitochondrial ATPase expression-domain-containing protein [Xylariaceae sp. FL0594]|nr:mitochondrial ATPase expression-domain-containing protein [Xylariaceae sp. FL0594]